MTAKIALSFLLLVFGGIVITFSAMVISANNDADEILLNIHALKTLKLKEDFPKNKIEILLKIEDPNFYEHDGVDYKTPGTGGVTITQYLVSYLFFDLYIPSAYNTIRRTFIAKYVLNDKMLKDDQLELFINSVELGTVNDQKVVGFQNAAKAFFQKDFVNINEEEYLQIIAMIHAPETFHIINEKAANLERVERIKMVLNGNYTPLDNTDWNYDKEELK